MTLTAGNGHNRWNSEDRRYCTVPEMQSLLQTIDRPIAAVADLEIRARTKLSNIELIKEYLRARGLNPEQILTRESLTKGATINTSEELQDYQLRILRNTFRELVRKEIDEAVQRPGQTSGTGGI